MSKNDLNSEIKISKKSNENLFEWTKTIKIDNNQTLNYDNNFKDDIILIDESIKNIKNPFFQKEFLTIEFKNNNDEVLNIKLPENTNTIKTSLIAIDELANNNLITHEEANKQKITLIKKIKDFFLKIKRDSKN